MPRKTKLDDVCTELMELERQYRTYLNSRNMLQNRLRSSIQGYLATQPEFSEEKPEVLYDIADDVIQDVRNGAAHPLADLIHNCCSGAEGFQIPLTAVESRMELLAEALPTYLWLQEPEQKGFGLKMMARIVGNTGNLCNYSHYGKVWKRMGCVPITHNGVTRMPSTWRRRSGLPDNVWLESGYNPIRRSVLWVATDPLLKQNGRCCRNGKTFVGPYRKEYETARKQFRERYPEGRKDNEFNHGMLMMGKLLLKNLWCVWNGVPLEQPPVTASTAVRKSTKRRKVAA